MSFSANDLLYYQLKKRELFALLPRLTITGWAWLVDLREVVTVLEPMTCREESRRHFERVYGG